MVARVGVEEVLSAALGLWWGHLDFRCETAPYIACNPDRPAVLDSEQLDEVI